MIVCMGGKWGRGGGEAGNKNKGISEAKADECRLSHTYTTMNAIIAMMQV